MSEENNLNVIECFVEEMGRGDGEYGQRGW
jgi:hypothetical protein